MTTHTNKTSLGTVAFIAGFAVLIMAVAAPFSDFFVPGKFVVPEKTEEPVQKNYSNNKVFSPGILGGFVNFICVLSTSASASK